MNSLGFSADSARLIVSLFRNHQRKAKDVFKRVARLGVHSSLLVENRKQQRKSLIALVELVARISAVCALPLALMAWTGIVHGQARAPFQMLDSGFPAEDAFRTAWVDDNRVLFHGVELGTYPCNVNEAQSCHRGHLNSAYIWDVHKKEVTRYRARILSRLCLQAGYISYVGRENSEDKEGSVYGGLFGDEKRLGFLSELRYHNQISCRYYAKPPEWEQRRGDGSNRRWVSPLLDGHGWLEMDGGSPGAGAPGESYTPTLFQSLGEPVQKLHIAPVPSRTLNYRYNLSYLPYVGKYLIWGISTSSEFLPPAWYFTPQGIVEKIEIPDGPWKAARYFGVKPGLLIVSGAGLANTGLYLVVQGRVTKILTGSTRQISVSPNGCRAAFVFSRHSREQTEGYRAWREGKAGNTVRVLDVCEGAK